jgi:hypothetical protein
MAGKLNPDRVDAESFTMLAATPYYWLEEMRELRRASLLIYEHAIAELGAAPMIGQLINCIAWRPHTFRF